MSTVAAHRTPEVTAALVAHALMALGMHMAENNLPLYLDLETPAAVANRGDRLAVHLGAEALDTWIASIEVDDITTDPIDDAVFTETFHVLGRLPNTGVRVDLFYMAPRGCRMAGGAS